MKHTRTLIMSLMLSLLSASVWADTLAASGLGVRGEANIKVPADWVSVNIGVETVADDAETALEANNRKMEEVRKALKKAGVKAEELSTGRFAITPRWEPRPSNLSASERSTWTPDIIAYQVSNQLQIASANLEQVGIWLQSATEAGANSLGNLNFSLENPDRHRAEAIRVATEKAKEYADAAASAAGVTLAELTLIEVDGASVTPRVQPLQQGREMSMMAMSDSASSKVSVEPGEIEVHASVRLNYRFQP